MLVDASGRDDAAVVRLDAERALVLTTDFFTPIVDDPYTFGQIAAANALSDVYAMGGRPRWCLNLVGWPRERLPLDSLGEVLRGGGEMVTRAGALILGGHSIDDPEPKYGLMVVGEVHPDRMITNAGARAGDVLVLTKPIGTGVISTAIKKDAAPDDALRAAVAAMTTLNDAAAAAAVEAGVRGGTDVSGFGLLGHLGSMLAASGVAAEIRAGAVPRLPGARRCGCRGDRHRVAGSARDHRCPSRQRPQLNPVSHGPDWPESRVMAGTSTKAILGQTGRTSDETRPGSEGDGGYRHLHLLRRHGRPGAGRAPRGPVLLPDLSRAARAPRPADRRPRRSRAALGRLSQGDRRS